MKVGTVVVVNETGDLGIVEVVYPRGYTYSCECLMVRINKRGEPRLFTRQEVTQIYRPRAVKAREK
jgi:hypothetical protein